MPSQTLKNFNTSHQCTKSVLLPAISWGKFTPPPAESQIPQKNTPNIQMLKPASNLPPSPLPRTRSLELSLARNRRKNRLQTRSSHIQNTNKSLTYSHISLSHSAFTFCSSRNENNLLRAYTTYVRLTLEYASTAWSPSYITQIIQLESVQRHFTETINGRHHISYSDRFESLKLQNLEHRRLIADLIMSYNIKPGHSCIDPSPFFTLNRYITSRGHSNRLSTLLAQCTPTVEPISFQIASHLYGIPLQ